jgi:hypothetical protein
MTGYIQLELGGKKRGVKFGNYALMEYSQLNGTGVAEVLNENPIKLCADLIYCGLKNNCYVKREVEDFTLEDVRSWVDSMDMQEINDVINTFTATQKISSGMIEIQEAIESKKTSSKSPKK